MATDLNRVLLIGNLTRDPELKQTQNGKSYCKFSIANNRTYTVDGNKREDTSFFNCTAFGRLGEIVQQYCQKGKKIAIEGRLSQRSWEKDGQKHSAVEIIADSVQLLGGLESGDGYGNNYQNEGPPRAGNGYGQQYDPNPMGVTYAELPDDEDVPF